MRKVLVVVMVLGLAVGGLAEKREVKPDNPFFKSYLSVEEIVYQLRDLFPVKRIVINETSPFSMKYIPVLYFLSFNELAFAQLYERLREGPVYTLKDLMNISYFGSERTVIKLLLLFEFPDEEEVLKKLKLEMPDWWVYYPLSKVR